MNKEQLLRLVPGALVACAACAHVDPPAIRDAPPSAETPDSLSSEPVPEQRPGDPSSPQAVAAALRNALADGWRELRIFDECLTDAGPQTVEIFGNGVAIWDRGQQFELAEGEIRRSLEAFVDIGFAQLKPEYGGRVAPDPDLGRSETRKPPDGSATATRVVCQVVLELDGVSKRVAQLDIGERSEALRELAEALLGISRAPARSGLAAADLDDGLEKVAAGELAPETVSILVHRKPQGGEGWLLRLDGPRASTRRFVPAKGYIEPVFLDLGAEVIADLARLMAGQGFGELPINLYAEHYTDLKVDVLDRRKSIQARPFAGITPTQHGEAQMGFDRIYEALRELHQEVLSEGK